MSDKVVVRMAPSPTGFLHVGTARTTIFNYLFARHHQGKFIIRVEDTDVERSSEEMTAAILEALKWLKIDWDGEVYYQSDRFAIYKEYAEKLHQEGKAYYCFCSPEELRARREQALAEKRSLGYDRRCLNLSEQQRAELDSRGILKALRIKTPQTGTARFIDIVGGELTRDFGELDDWVIMRADGRCTYNFSCVVDDHLMEISHVIRGNDHIANTFKQQTIYDAFGWEKPQFAHVPLILGKDRAKISKRHGAISVADYQEDGILPEALFNFLALLGWSAGDDREIMTRQELIESFSLERINASNPIFDPVKLEWMNFEYIQKLDDNELLERARWVLINAGLTTRLSVESHWQWHLKVIHLMRERMKTLNDLPRLGRFFYTDDFDYDEKGVKKHFADPDTAQRLKQWHDELAGVEDDFGASKIESALRKLADNLGINPSAIIHPTRLALTGMTGGPGLFELMELLGKENCLARIDRAIDYVKGVS